MSRYTKHYDASNRNFDVNTKTYDSPRYVYQVTTVELGVLVKEEEEWLMIILG